MREFMRGHLIGRNSDCPISGGGCSLESLSSELQDGGQCILVASCSRNMHDRENREFKCCTYKYSYTIGNTMITQSGVRTNPQQAFYAHTAWQEKKENASI